MPNRPGPYIPQDIEELLDHLTLMMSIAPHFKDETGYFPDRNADREFFVLHEGLLVIRQQIGEARYSKLIALSDDMRKRFEEARVAEKNPASLNAGLRIAVEMEQLLKEI
ncbi:MAG: hypothetical protein U1E03_10515 [Hyphomonadaceae bacterium]